MEVSGQLHVPAALPPVKEITIRIERGRESHRAGLRHLVYRKALASAENRTTVLVLCRSYPVLGTE